jgi:hypothetical protein
MIEQDSKDKGQPFVPYPEFSQFSDCIVLSTKTDRLHRFLFIRQVVGINRALFAMGLLLRGGISKGSTFHKGSIAFGPALTKAYDLEQKAVYPRIIIDPELEPSFLESQNCFDNQGNPFQFQWFRRAPDGFLFLDFLLEVGKELPPHATDEELLRRTATSRDLIVAGLEENRYDTRKWEKYRWLAEYFNEIAAEYPGAGFETVPRMSPKMKR